MSATLCIIAIDRRQQPMSIAKQIDTLSSVECISDVTGVVMGDSCEIMPKFKSLPITIEACKQSLRHSIEHAAKVRGIQRVLFIPPFGYLLHPDLLAKLLAISQREKMDFATIAFADGCFAFREKRFPEIIDANALHQLKLAEYPQLEYFEPYTRSAIRLGDVFRCKVIGLSPQDWKPVLLDRFGNNFSFPQFVSIYFTNQCNLRCIMCPYHSETTPLRTTSYFDKKRELPLNVFKKVATEVAMHGAVLGFGGTGEPTNNPVFPHYVEAAKKCGVEEVFLGSNGTYFNQNSLAIVAKTGIDIISFSLDAMTPETYGKIRGAANLFPRIVQSVYDLIELREKNSWNKPAVFVSFVYQESNQHELDEFVRHWTPIADQVGVFHVASLEGRYDTRNSHPLKRIPCILPWRRMDILADGEVLPCCRLFVHLLKVGMPEISVGNVFESSLTDIWCSGKLMGMREALVAERWEHLPVCRICETWASHAFVRDWMESGLRVAESPDRHIYSRARIWS